MTPIDRAARALYQREPQTIDVFTGDFTKPSPLPERSARPMPWEVLSDEYRKPYLDAARDVIAAIREPSEAMGVAGVKALHDVSDARFFEPEDKPEHIFSAMIDAALAE